MRRLRRRHTVALLGMGLVVFAAFAAWVSPAFFTATFTPLWLLLPVLSILVLRCAAARRGEQSESLLSLVLSRAPPARLAFV